MPTQQPLTKILVALQYISVILLHTEQRKPDLHDLLRNYLLGNYLLSNYLLSKDLLSMTYLAMADGAISSRFSMLHSSKNSRIGDGCEPTEMYAIKARFFTRPTAPPCGQRETNTSVSQWTVINILHILCKKITKIGVTLVVRKRV